MRGSSRDDEVTDLRTVPLSVLELSPVSSGSTASDALRATVGLAQHVEDLGYARFWLAEHHNNPGIASSSPAVLIAAVASATLRIRVGSGGVMLPNHPPLVVAEQFGTLAGLFPGRIDLGIGRAPGTDQMTARALRRSVGPLSADDFPEQLGDLIGFLGGEFPAGHHFRTIAAVPQAAQSPQLWLLGSSGYSAQVAGMLGLPFAFAHHFSSRNTVPALDLYRQSFQASDVLAAPHCMVAVRVLVAESDERAAWLGQASTLSFLRLLQGRPDPLPSPDEAAAHPWTDEERAAVAERHLGQAVGGPETVRAELADLLERTSADELMATTLVHDPAVRQESFTLLRELFGNGTAP
jgi:luciferase family oxidoreductase group 1